MKVKRGPDDVVCVCFEFDGLGKIRKSDSIIYAKAVNKQERHSRKRKRESIEKLFKPLSKLICLRIIFQEQ